jgi:hypothetical protein
MGVKRYGVGGSISHNRPSISVDKSWIILSISNSDFLQAIPNLFTPGIVTPSGCATQANWRERAVFGEGAIRES